MTQSNLRVLVVDDEPAIRRALRPPLVELGFEVTEVSRGEMALDVLRTESFDAVLLDVNMPGIGGDRDITPHSGVVAAATGPYAHRS